MIDSIRPFPNDSLQCLHKQENKNKIICLLKMIFNKHFNAVIENRISSYNSVPSWLLKIYCKDRKL